MSNQWNTKMNESTFKRTAPPGAFGMKLPEGTVQRKCADEYEAYKEWHEDQRKRRNGRTPEERGPVIY